MKCPGFEQLIEYCEASLTARDAQLIAAHLATGCQKCADDLQWYERVRRVASHDDRLAPPPWVLKRALKLFDRERGQGEAVGNLGRMVASLIFDSLSQPAVAGARSAEIYDRQLLYRAGHYSIDLQIAISDQSRAELNGQVLRENESGFESVAALPLDLIGKGERLHSTATNEVGEFSIKSLNVGDYDLLIETREGVISVLRFPVGPAPTAD
jgi:hypothetical protein